MRLKRPVTFLLGCASLIVTLSVIAAPVAAQDDPYTFTPSVQVPFALVSDAVTPIDVVSGSVIISNSPGGPNVYVSSLRGLPADAYDNLIGGFDLVGGRTYVLIPDTLTAFGLACEDVVVYKVNIDATTGPFPSASCGEGNELTINNTDGSGTFLLFEAFV